MLKTRYLGELIVYADGSILPQRAGVGVAVCDTRGTILQLLNQILPTMTNNEAEYAALHLALIEAAKIAPQQLEIRMDSEVVIKQMTGHFAVHSPRLKIMHQKACELARQFGNLRYTHIPREVNTLADALAAEASAGRAWRTRS